MITRLPGGNPTRSRAVCYNGVVHTVAVSPEKTPSVYEQTRGALASIERSLAEVGADRTRVLTAIVYLTDMAQKDAMNRAWDEWVSPDHPPMRACIGALLEGQDLVEIVVTAALPDTR